MYAGTKGYSSSGHGGGHSGYGDDYGYGGHSGYGGGHGGGSCVPSPEQWLGAVLIAGAGVAVAAAAFGALFLTLTMGKRRRRRETVRDLGRRRETVWELGECDESYIVGLWHNDDRKQTFMIRLENDDGNMMSGCVLECYYCFYSVKLDINSSGCVKVFSVATQHTERGTELN